MSKTELLWWMFGTYSAQFVLGQAYFYFRKSYFFSMDQKIAWDNQVDYMERDGNINNSMIPELLCSTPEYQRKVALNTARELRVRRYGLSLASVMSTLYMIACEWEFYHKTKNHRVEDRLLKEVKRVNKTAYNNIPPRPEVEVTEGMGRLSSVDE